MIKKILIGIDDSTYAEHAAEYGFSIADSLNAHVGLVHITEPMIIAPVAPVTGDEITTGAVPPVDINGLELLDIQQHAGETILDKVAQKYGGKTEITHFNQFGSTGEGIIDCSQEFAADLIVLGTHKRTGFDRLLNGSIAEYVVRHSHIPVLVVPSPL